MERYGLYAGNLLYDAHLKKGGVIKFFAFLDGTGHCGRHVKGDGRRLAMLECQLMLVFMRVFFSARERDGVDVVGGRIRVNWCQEKGLG